MTSKGIKWDFNAHYAPHFGGVLEAMIKVAKQARMAIFSKADFTDKELMTPFTGAEALINSKPLAYQSANWNDVNRLPLITFSMVNLSEPLHQIKLVVLQSKETIEEIATAY